MTPDSRPHPVASESARTGREASELERSIARVTAVQSCKVVLGQGGRIAEVHVLASSDRSPKQIVRDIQSVLLATFDLGIDYRAVSVVQLAEPSEGERASVTKIPTDPQPESTPRVALVGIRSESRGRSSEVAVEFALGGETVGGSAAGPSTSGLRLVALAVADGLGGMTGAEGIEVDFADLITTARSKVAVAILTVTTSRGDHVLSGSAIVRKDANDAVARATMAALNRLIVAE